MLSSARLALKYGIFACMATATNIGTQDLSIRLYNGAFGMLISVAVGTGAGLFVKYLLDKRYIFRFRAHFVINDSPTSEIYTLSLLLAIPLFQQSES